jgi:predicted small secreted protein
MPPEEIRRATGSFEHGRAEVNPRMPNSALLRSLLLAALLVAVGTGLAGCNTIEGAGKDIQAAGSAMSGTAKDTKEEMTQ